MKTVVIGIPTYNSTISWDTCASLLWARDTCKVMVDHTPGSALPFVFNRIFCNARKSGCDQFCMLHSDLGSTSPTWLRDMQELMEKSGVDCLSVVSPIKNAEGYSSTAVDTDPDDPRKFCMREMANMPDVFTNEQCKERFGKPLLINTGMMLLNLGAQWQHISFRFEDYINKDLEAKFRPEDWNFSRDMDEAGIKYGVTNRIPLNHHGSMFFTNSPDWGYEAEPDWII